MNVAPTLSHAFPVIFLNQSQSRMAKLDQRPAVGLGQSAARQIAGAREPLLQPVECVE